jgi:hypothetical protein
MKSRVTDVSAPAFEAGAAAGRRWAKSSRNSARLERLRHWLGARRRVIDYVDRFIIYSTLLTDRFMVAGPVEGCAQQYCVPMLKAERLATGYWGRLKGWPRRGTEQQTRFIEGFVRGAVGADKARFDSLLDHVRAIVAGASMFDPKSQRKIGTQADKLWTELRNARKRQVLAGTPEVRT